MGLDNIRTGKTHWLARVEGLAETSKQLLAQGQQESKNGGLTQETRELIDTVRDQMNEALGEYMDRSKEEEGEVLEDSLIGLFKCMKDVLGEQPTKPKPQGRPFSQRKKQRIGEV